MPLCQGDIDLHIPATYNRRVIIDFHTHIVPPTIKERRADYIGRDPLFDSLYSDPKARLATADELIESMDRDGVDVSIALNIAWISHQMCLETNDYIMESVSRYPDRIVGFGSIQPLAGEAAVAEMERCARGGLRGIGEMRPDIQGFDLGDEGVMGPIAEAARSHGLILLTHASEPVGHQYPGKGTVTPDMLYRFITSFPDLSIVLAHWGGGLPFYALMPEVKEAMGNVFFDTAASPYLYRVDIFKHVAEIAGEERILFGSDYPLIPQRRIVDDIRALPLPDRAREMILGENARALLGGA